MGLVEELYEKKKIFNELFGSLAIAIEGKDGDLYVIIVKSEVYVVEEKVEAAITLLEGEINERIEKVFRIPIPPQDISFKCNHLILSVNAVDLLFTDNWNSVYPDLLLESVEQNFGLIEVVNENNKPVDHNIRYKGIYYC
ncbi:hypothetical protein [Ornithinibacillus contaminans]|uniref:hypothetical protein n=1 Tax=Ornithinibacillus contaminans TaxID=694055 RepID=UPI00064DD201|nr:hypothetical protein [Ornithinibacillus contaminans]